jgi:glycine/D-amino acid oxidase-like deaminating enzyme
VGDVTPRSPWVAQLAPDPPARPLESDVDEDVVVIGAGIAGVATAFFTLRHTTRQVLLLERFRVGRGATGHNAGQLTTYFERPLHQIAAEFGSELAVAAQRGIEGAHELLDLMCAEAGADLRIERFIGRMGMFALNHLEVHLRDNVVRRGGDLPVRDCAVSEDASFLDAIPAEFDGLYRVVAQREVRELLRLDDDRYWAVLSEPKGCANSALLVQRVLAHLERTYPDRFRYHDHTQVDRIVLDGDGGSVHTPNADVRARSIVLCTNGFAHHTVETASGDTVIPPLGREVISTIGFMSAFFEAERCPAAALSFIRNEVIGSATPYVYVTRRTYDTGTTTQTLTCMGGPEHPIDGPSYDRTMPYPGSMVRHMDASCARMRSPTDRPASRSTSPGTA